MELACVVPPVESYEDVANVPETQDNNPNSGFGESEIVLC